MKEVDGIFTADPNKSRRAAAHHHPVRGRRARYGSEVIHPPHHGQCRRTRRPIRIKNVKNGDAGPSWCRIRMRPAADIAIAPSDGTHSAESKRPTAVTIKDRISVINVPF